MNPVMASATAAQATRGVSPDQAPSPGSAADEAAHRYWKRVDRQKDEILVVREDALRRRTLLQRWLERVAQTLAHPAFFLGEAAFHVLWVLANSGWVPDITPWDPYPFGFLFGLASVQAFFVGLLILMHTRFESRIGELREEIDLQVALHAERETTKLLRMVAEVQRALGITSCEFDAELREMAQPLRPDRLMRETEEHLDDAKRS